MKAKNSGQSFVSDRIYKLMKINVDIEKVWSWCHESYILVAQLNNIQRRNSITDIAISKLLWSIPSSEDSFL